MTTRLIPVATVTLGGTLAAPQELPANEASNGTTFISGDTEGYFVNDGATMVRYVCVSSGSLTFVFQRTVEGQAITNFNPSVTTGHTYIFGPFSKQDFNDASGIVHLQRSQTTDATSTIGLYKIPATPAN